MSEFERERYADGQGEAETIQRNRLTKLYRHRYGTRRRQSLERGKTNLGIDVP